MAAPERTPMSALAIVLIVVVTVGGRGCGGRVCLLGRIRTVQSGHRRMVRERERAHASVRDRLWERAEKVDTAEWEGGDPTLLDIMNRLAGLEEASSLERAERRIDEIHDWPFDTRIVGRFAALTLTVVAVLLTRYAATLVGI